MTVEQVRNLIVVRLATLGDQLACLIEAGDTNCNPKHEEILCNGFKLYSMLEAINNEDSLAELQKENPNLLERWYEIITTIGGISVKDYVNVEGDTFISFAQYYNQWQQNNNTGGGDDDCICFEPVEGLGRNFETPTLYNQYHNYTDINQLVQALLFPALAPRITSWTGSMTINGGTSSALTLIEKGTIVRDVTVTMIAARQSSNSGLLASASTTLPSPTPASPTDISPDAANHTQVWATTINAGGVTTWAAADKNNRTFTSTVTDANSKTATSGSIGYTFGNGIFYGSAVIGVVNETFIKSLTKVLDTNPQMNPVNYSIGSLEHGWFFYPDAWGDVQFFDNAVNIAGGFTRINGATLLPNGETVVMSPTILLTFDNGYTELYRGYITDNHTLGSVSFRTV